MHQFLLEVKCRALLGLKEYDRARLALNDCRSQMAENVLEQLATYPLLSQIYRESGDVDLATRTLAEMERYIRQAEANKKCGAHMRYMLYRLALERQLLGDLSRAHEAGRIAFDWCKEWNDQTGAIRCAMVLLRTYSTSLDRRGASEQIYRDLLSLADRTHFRLERAYAYWELGMHADILFCGSRKGCVMSRELLGRSHSLFETVPLVDSLRACDVLKQMVSTSEGYAGTASDRGTVMDSVYEKLMDYASCTWA